MLFQTMSFYRVSLGGNDTLDLGLSFLSFSEWFNLQALLVEGGNGNDASLWSQARIIRALPVSSHSNLGTM
jgi:hypothetical protein